MQPRTPEITLVSGPGAGYHEPMAAVWQWREDRAEELWQAAREHLNAAQLLALPTETFYALAAHPFQEKALAHLFSLKRRSPDKPVLLLVSGPDMVDRLARDISALAIKLMARFWPGPLTLILPARPELSWRLTGGTGGVGLRQPRQAVTCRLIAALGFPVTGTSANLAGQAALTRAAEVERTFGEDLALILDAGPCPGGLPSTVVDVSRDTPRLVRAGAVPPADILKIIPGLVVDR